MNVYSRYFTGVGEVIPTSFGNNQVVMAGTCFIASFFPKHEQCQCLILDLLVHSAQVGLNYLTTHADWTETDRQTDRDHLL